MNKPLATALLALFIGISCQAQDRIQQAETAGVIPVSQFVDGKIVLTADQIAPNSNVAKRQDGSLPVFYLNNACYQKNPGTGGFAEWKLEAPLPEGWWHGVAESSLNFPQYSNREIGFALGNEQVKTQIPYSPHNFWEGEKGKRQTFEFWIYSPVPFNSVRYVPTTDLYRWNDSWPLAKLTLEQKSPEGLSRTDAISLNVPVKDGAAQLPGPTLPLGSYWITATVYKTGSVTVTTEDGKTVTMPITPDQYGRPLGQTRYFFTDQPVTQITSSPANLISRLSIQHKKTGQYVAKDLPDKQPLIQLFDEKKSQTATLELVGTNLDGSAPTLADFPFGKKIAVVTTWDDGAKEDMRAAELFQKHGYHPTFFLNNSSVTMAQIAKLEEMGAEVGSHGYGHPFLYQIPPAEADFHMIEQRRALEAKLGHPVISMAYPNGYSTAYDVTGDYVLTAVKKAGYLSGRTTSTADLSITKMGDLLKMPSNGFFGYGKQLIANYEKRKNTEGEIFYFWGHSWQIGKTDQQWADFETLIATFANNPEAWYATQGDLSVWDWLRNNTRLEVATKSPTSTKVTLTRPTLHPWLASRVPFAIKVPAGVTQVKWQGKVLEVQDGKVDLNW